MIRLPILPRWKSPIGRMLHYLSFSFALLAGGSRLPRPDALLFFSSTPLLGAAASLLLARIHRCPFLYGIQDVYPEMAVALGVLRNRFLVRVARSLESWAWRGASRVILISRDLRTTACSRGVSDPHLVVIPNWEDPARIVPIAGSPFRREIGFSESDFVVEYAGNFGRSQDLEAVLEAARIVERCATLPIRFLLVGGGALATEVRRSAATVKGVRVLPFQPEERLAEVLSAADLSLVPLRRGLSRYCVPSKIYSILASGRPVGAALDRDSAAARIVEEVDCGFRVEPGDAEALAAEIMRLAGDPDRARRQGQNGRRYGEQEGSLERAARRYESVLHAAISLEDHAIRRGTGSERG